MTRFIFITGGVVSSLGKGLCSAALGALLQARGFTVRLRKLDPYLNVDPGTMSPYQHGEVFVTDDGAETDLDLGHYERYVGVAARKSDSVTTGRIYSTVISRERRGEYLGATVQVIPHVTDAIKEFILADLADEDFVLCEIGGTVGDIESLPFLEAIRQLGNELGRERVMFIHLTLVPWINSAEELKTKPTQHSAKELLGLGIQPDILLCRCDRPIPDGARKKIALFCNLREARVIPALDVDTIYAVPGAYHAEGFDREVCAHFGLDPREPDLARWDAIVSRIHRPEGEVTIAIVGKYTHLRDSYKSLAEAMTHAASPTTSGSGSTGSIRRCSRPNPRRCGNWRGCTRSSSRAASANAARKARSRRRALPASAKSPISASASACRWRSSRRRGISPRYRAPARPSSARARIRSSG